MKTAVEVETGDAAWLQEILGPSLKSDDRVSYSIEADQDRLSITVETDSLGPLRGAADTVFRLTMLSKKIIER